MANAARTRDLLNHNQMLYQLSYIHHVHVNGEPFRTTSDYYTRFFPFVLIGVLRFRPSSDVHYVNGMLRT